MPEKKSVPPTVAFIPIGAALIVIGLGNNPAFIGAGVLFIIGGVVGIIRRRQERPNDSPPPAETED